MSDRDSTSRRIGAGADPASGRQSRREDKRQHFSAREQPGRARKSNLTIRITVAGLLVAFVLVGALTFANKGGSSSATGGTAAASSGPVQQVAATTSLVENGQVSITVDEVKAKKLVAWDYKSGKTTVPLVAYTTPSGAVKVAARMCEPCNSTTFHIEGTQLVCNSCGSRWELENSKGVSGGCQQYPPELLPGTVVDGKISVDELKVSSWKPRV